MEARRSQHLPFSNENIIGTLCHQQSWGRYMVSCHRAMLKVDVLLELCSHFLLSSLRKIQTHPITTDLK